MQKSSSMRCPRCDGIIADGLRSENFCLRCLLFLALGRTSDKRENIGGYEIVSTLGRGGMGTVYKALSPDLQDLVALKILAEPLAEDPAFVKRFDLEANAASRLQHPNIVAVYEAGVDEAHEDGEKRFISMEYVRGITIAEKLRQKGVLGVDEALDIMAQTLSALSAAHALRIVHRDIKPVNIMLDAAGVVKVMDFGLAKSGDDLTRLTLTLPGSVLGTPPYMAPEQCRGEVVDHRTDLYAAGVLLFEMLTARVPFGGPTPEVVIHRILTEEPPAIRTINPRVPKSVTRIIATALAKDPAHRYSSAEAMANDLRDVLAERQAIRDGTLAQRRRRAWISRWMVGVALCLVFAAGIWGYHSHARRERDLRRQSQLPREGRFADANLQAAIQKATGLKKVEWTSSDFQGLRKLEACNAGITNLSGIERCIRLKFLDLRGNAIEDIRPLAALPVLGGLIMTGSTIQDLSPFQNMHSLRQLMLSMNRHHYATLDPLGSLIGLRDLSLSYEFPQLAVNDISPIGRLVNLEYLDVGKMNIVDFRPLASLKRLKTISFHGSNLSSLEPLRDLTELEALDLGNTYVRDFSTLQRFPNLWQLNLQQNTTVSGKDLVHIRNMKKLKNLWLKDCLYIDDDAMDHLMNMTQLERLDLGKCENVTDEGLKKLKRLTSLKTLNIGATKITEAGIAGFLDAVPNCRILRKRYAWDFSSISADDALKYLDAEPAS